MRERHVHGVGVQEVLGRGEEAIRTDVDQHTAAAGLALQVRAHLGEGHQGNVGTEINQCLGFGEHPIAQRGVHRLELQSQMAPASFFYLHGEARWEGLGNVLVQLLCIKGAEGVRVQLQVRLLQGGEVVGAQTPRRERHIARGRAVAVQQTATQRSQHVATYELTFDEGLGFASNLRDEVSRCYQRRGCEGSSAVRALLQAKAPRPNAAIIVIKMLQYLCGSHQQVVARLSFWKPNFIRNHTTQVGFVRIPERKELHHDGVSHRRALRIRNRLR
mmetsp:Transcript_39947/g.69166  ORF Transcript_39947/g.69166 Transcript_39947/m.69166 type:complete len:274 (-) Transcript_39947:383-1204(-)